MGEGVGDKRMSEETLQDLVLFFHYVGPRGQTQVVRFSRKGLYPMKHHPVSTNPYWEIPCCQSQVGNPVLPERALRQRVTLYGLIPGGTDLVDFSLLPRIPHSEGFS